MLGINSSRQPREGSPVPGTPKQFTRGTHRVLDPAATAARVMTLARPLGITRVANVTGLDCIGIPVTMVCRPNASSLSVSQGKGADLDAARASGLMEATELYHAEHITHPLKLASWNELRFSHQLAAVDELPRISISRFSPNHRLLWIAGIDLHSSQQLWLPFELVHTNYTLPLPTGSGCFVMSSNGLASGNHILEAVSHGLCEVIERDADSLFRLFSLERQAERRVALHSIDDPECRHLLKRYENAGVTVGVWDITSELGIAAFRCVILDQGNNPFRRLGPVEGMGCHPVREIALSRALTEAAQGRLTLIAGSRDDNGRARYSKTQDSELIERARQRLVESGSRAFECTPTHNNNTFEGDLTTILGALRNAGFREAIVVDLSKPEFGIPVARVVVPGLEPYHRIPGYLPGARALRQLEVLAKEREA